MLTSIQEEALLNAVPSFGRRWADSVRDQADYESRYPEEAQTPRERTHAFLFALSHHLGPQVARGELRETEWLFAALEPVYRVADEELENELTIGFLEGLIYVIEGAGANAAVLHSVSKGELTEQGWQAAYRYIHPQLAIEQWGA